MLLFVDHVAGKRLILAAMDSVAGGSTRLIEGTRGLIHDAFLALVRSAVESGDLREDTVPGDLVRGLIGVFYTTAQPGWEASARRIVDILIAGSRADGPEAVGGRPHTTKASQTPALKAGRPPSAEL